jgi:FtsP/CotA-like multicopper oxidase with cupredoxin domain
MSIPFVQRRRLLRALGALAALGTGALTIGWRRGVRVPSTPELCATPGAFDTPLHVPGLDGRMGRLAVGGRPIVLRAAPYGSDGALAFTARSDGRDYIDPTLVVRTGERVAIRLENRLAEPTVAHWHGLTMDTANDGNGDVLIEADKSFAYAYEVRNRSGLYWYHPHPHGATAGQTYRGLFGLIDVEDDDTDKLRTTLSVVPGRTEIPLVLQDRRTQSRHRYSPTREDLLLGWFGDEVLVNFTPRPYLDVTGRSYRFRVLNACNARNFRLVFRRDDGAAIPFLLLGTDGGLLERPQPCTEVFVSPAERVDVLVDFAGIATGGYALLESRAFDPMHDLPIPRADAAAAGAETAHDMRAPPGRASAPSAIADGAPLQLLQFRVRAAGPAAPAPPPQLSAPWPALSTATERPLRLGFAKGRWRINDRVYDMADVPIVVARNATEIWLIRNYHTSMPHAMHLHGFQFRVLERETSPDLITSLAVDPRGRIATDLGWKDTLLVWPGESVKIAIDFRLPFAGEQTYLFHCHNLEHEDGGMMLRVRVG